jgi:hypothetical protein
MVHGIKTLGSDHVLDCWANKNFKEFKYFLNELKEKQYHRNQR